MKNQKATFAISAVLVAVVLIGAGLESAAAYTRPGKTERVSVSSDGTEQDTPGLNNPGLHQAISRTGRYIVFSSIATNLSDEPDNDNGGADVFLHDRKTHETEWISRTSNGLDVIAPLGDPLGSVTAFDASNPDVSKNGRYVVFESDAPLAVSDVDLYSDIYLRDRKEGTTTLLSGFLPDAGDPLAAMTVHFAGPSMSSNTRYMSFLAWDLGWQLSEVLLLDRKTGKLTVVSKTSAGQPSVGQETCPQISEDGSHVVFSTFEPFSAADTYIDTEDVYIWDARSNKLEFVSRPPVQIEPVSPIPPESTTCRDNPATDSAPTLSHNDRYVVFNSDRNDLVPNDPYISPWADKDVYVRDLKTGRIRRISVLSTGESPLEATGSDQAISGDGRIATISGSSNLSGGSGGCPAEDVTGEAYAIDLRTGQLDCLGLGFDGSPGRVASDSQFCGSRLPVPAYAGRLIALLTECDNYVRNDTNGIEDVFVRDRGLPLSVGQLAAKGRAKHLSLEGAASFGDSGRATFDDVDSDALASKSKLALAGELIGAALTYRPQLDDLFVVLELESMPRTPALAAATAGLVYGMSFEVDGKPYEVRVASTGVGPGLATTAAFGLFDCSSGTLLCSHVAELEGGFGTTGERVTVSVPLRELGLVDGSVISKVRAFTALGTLAGGSTRTVDVASF